MPDVDLAGNPASGFAGRRWKMKSGKLDELWGKSKMPDVNLTGKPPSSFAGRR
ncbi:hypothetical protein [Fundicoccus culcitae]|uniref:Uncharacterized protein n=1 Tax=Fundicoccus culcitae TaxID=2969821 RepID=A0ABY5P9Q5_9LACT|nr:hypothetical protein [Fundicoccus culcitae]UUX35264.1 hypothetical protein NRE15_06365 [Fundicoccus culcitae]